MPTNQSMKAVKLHVKTDVKTSGISMKNEFRVIYIKIYSENILPTS